MRLFESIVEANQRGQRGGQIGALLGGLSDALPVAALTCIDARLNKLVPEALGIPEDKFIWLRNAGNIIFDSTSSMTRTMALACAIKGGKEIAIIGHTDCYVGKASMVQITDRFRALGVDRTQLPDNLNEFFGLFASERQNVIRGCDFIRRSPLIGPQVPVHGLLLDTASGRLEWVVNGYQALETATSNTPTTVVEAAKEFRQKIGAAVEAVQDVVSEVRDFKIGEMKFPSGQIGELATEAGQWMKELGSAGTGNEIGAAGSVPGTGSNAAVATPPLLSAMEMTRRLDPGKRFKVIGRDQKVYGPVTVAELLAWLDDNRIDHTTPLQREDGPAWKPLGDWLKREVEKKIEAKLRKR